MGLFWALITLNYYPLITPNNHQNIFHLFPVWYIIFLQKFQKTVKHFGSYSQRLFWARFGRFLPQFGQTGFFPINQALSLLTHYESLTSYQKSEKKLWPNSEKSALLTDRLTDRPESIWPFRKRRFKKSIHAVNVISNF